MSHQEFFQEITKDHKALLNTIQQLKSEASENTGDLIVQLKMELTPHQDAEERTFYRALEEQPDYHKMALKGEEEHHVAASILKELEEAPKDDRWTAKLEVLEEIVQEHIQEEESKAFQAARSIDENEINDILRDYQRTKLQIKSNMHNPDILDKEEFLKEDTKSGNLPYEDLGTVV